MHEFQCQGERGLEAEDAERRAIEFDILAGRAFVGA